MYVSLHQALKFCVADHSHESMTSIRGMTPFNGRPGPGPAWLNAGVQKVQISRCGGSGPVAEPSVIVLIISVACSTFNRNP